MVRRHKSKREEARRCCDKPCRQELLMGAFLGLYDLDQCLECMLDHLEQAT
ncbi:hypothetical protein GCM10007385_40280 [Tateyamaria omphalii]|nr:hypothetical protein GCM10007385_40280 [Tateyamaria omphalii]